MDVSNSTGENTDYRLATGPPPGRPKKAEAKDDIKGGRKELPLKRLGPNSHHKNVRPPSAAGPWYICFLKAGTTTVLADAMLMGASCLVILTEAGKGKFAVRVSTPVTPPKKASRTRSTAPGARAESSSEMLPQERA